MRGHRWWTVLFALGMWLLLVGLHDLNVAKEKNGNHDIWICEKLFIYYSDIAS